MMQPAQPSYNVPPPTFQQEIVVMEAVPVQPGAGPMYMQGPPQVAQPVYPPAVQAQSQAEKYA